MNKAIVLLSGGLDSTVAAYLLRPEIEPVLALTVDYGQKAARRELGASYAIALRLGIPHRTVFIPFLREAARGALVDPRVAPPEPMASELDDTQGAAARSALAVWVPNRNAVLISMAATWAEVNQVEHVVCGFNREEAETFPDNSRGFLDAMNATLKFSTRNGVTVIAPTIEMDKVEMQKAGLRAGAPLELVWSCYLGGDHPCGRCESCRRFQRAAERAGLKLVNGRIQAQSGGNP